MKKKILLPILLLLLTLTSCSAMNPFKKVEFQINESFIKKVPNTVATLPFKNETDNKDAPYILRKSFYQQFSTKRFKDVELSDVDYILFINNLSDKNLNIEDSKRLGKILKADALIYGDIKRYR